MIIGITAQIYLDAVVPMIIYCICDMRKIVHFAVTFCRTAAFVHENIQKCRRQMI